MDDADFIAFVKTCHEMQTDMIRLVDEIAVILDEELIRYLIILLAVFFSIDNRITKNEYSFLMRFAI